ncbi:MAG: glycosyltransferase family 2 protein [Vicinamibacterales bacterium]
MVEPSATEHRVSVLVPVYNEERTVATVLERVLALPFPLDIVVVDDGSSDRTHDVVAAVAAREPRVRLFRQTVNQGKTAAIRRAIAEATGTILIVQDADLEYDPAEIPEVLAPILSGHADVVYGSRFLVRRAARVLYFYHYLANSGLTFLSNLLTNRNMTDIETCYKAFRAGVIKPLTLTSRGFGMEVEITAMVSQTRARTYEVPISYYGRSYEEGKKIGLLDGVMALYYILYFNLIAPRLSAGRRYVQEVNRNLASL